jgi:hypothetical protein
LWTDDSVGSVIDPGGTSVWPNVSPRNGGPSSGPSNVSWRRFHFGHGQLLSVMDGPPVPSEPPGLLIL